MHRELSRLGYPPNEPPQQVRDQAEALRAQLERDQQDACSHPAMKIMAELVQGMQAVRDGTAVLLQDLESVPDGSEAAGHSRALLETAMRVGDQCCALELQALDRRMQVGQCSIA